MPIRAVAVDIDGTLTDYARLVDWAGVRALRDVEKKGLPVILATGNVVPVTKALANFIGTSGPLVCEGGGAISSNDMRRKRLLFSRARADRAIARLRGLGFAPRRIWSDPWRESEVALDLSDDHPELRRRLAAQGFELVSTRFALHVMEPGLDKYRGIVEALDFLQRRVRPTEVLGIGDSNNDVTMLRRFRYSGCVGNGSEAARAAAKFVARRKHGAGVTEILRHYKVL